MTQENNQSIGSTIQSPFTPFEEKPAPVTTPAAQQPPKRARSRKNVAKPAKSPKAPKKKETSAAAVQSPPARKKRKRRAASAPQTRQPRGLKLPVNIVLAATGRLKASDTAVFEKVLGILSGAAKGQRKRVLDALGKVFA